MLSLPTGPSALPSLSECQELLTWNAQSSTSRPVPDQLPESPASRLVPVRSFDHEAPCGGEQGAGLELRATLFLGT